MGDLLEDLIIIVNSSVIFKNIFIERIIAYIYIYNII